VTATVTQTRIFPRRIVFWGLGETSGFERNARTVTT
jgi:hypothetical protein